MWNSWDVKSSISSLGWSRSSSIVWSRYCQVDGRLVDRPPRYWARASREPATLGIRNGRQPQLDNTLIWAYDGRTGWRNQPTAPAPLIELTGGNLVGAGIDAMVSFPTEIQQAFAEWEVGFSDIDVLEVDVVRGSNAGQRPVNLYFDESGLLVRLVRWTETGAGPVPIQTDYSDYREVAGVQMPFHWVVSWTNGRSTVQLNDVQPNAAIDDARFARPDPAQLIR